MFYIFVVLHIILTFCYILHLQNYLMLVTILILYFIIFMVLLNILTNLLDMLVLVIIKLCNFHVLHFCDIIYYSYPLLYIMLTILLNVIFFFCIT